MPYVSATNLELPLSNELRQVAQVLLPNMQANEPIFDWFPDENTNDTLLRWFQEDNYSGLQGVRGYNGKPGRVKLHGTNEFICKPAVYGEYIPLDEETITKRRQTATYGTPIDVEDLTALAFRLLLHRRVSRKALILWNLVINGTFSVVDGFGTVVHTDSYTPQTYAPPTYLWSDHTNGAPLADIRTMQQSSVGKSVDFGANATLLMNRVTANHLLANNNPADFGGRKGMYGITGNISFKAVNTILEGEDLPQIRVYDGGYQPESRQGANDQQTFVKFIANGKIQLMGKRLDGAPIGAYRMTANVNNPNAGGGPYSRMIDKGEFEIPREVECHDGHNGGPVLYFPSAMVTGTVL